MYKVSSKADVPQKYAMECRHEKMPDMNGGNERDEKSQ